MPIGTFVVSVWIRGVRDVCADAGDCLRREAEKLAFRPSFAVMNHRGMYINGRAPGTVESEKVVDSDATTEGS